MIPKIIHYCWFGPNPLPPMVKMCIGTWKQHLPDYHFMFWNEENSPMDFPFVKEAYEKKKYAFVSDYVRLWAVYKHGGIYLDTDMYLTKSLDAFICESVFFGYEEPNRKHISAGIIGAEKGNEFIGKVRDQYCHLKLGNDITVISIPIIISNTYDVYQQKNDIKIYDYDYFYPFPHKKRKKKNFLKYSTNDTHAIHLWNFSWLTTKEKILLRFIWLGRFFGIIAQK